MIASDVEVTGARVPIAAAAYTVGQVPCAALDSSASSRIIDAHFAILLLQSTVAKTAQ